MAGASGSSSCKAKNSKKNIPEMVSELLDLAIFSFSCQSGLKSNHKIRGDPVLEGVAAFLGRLISCSNRETQTAFQEISPERLGNWQPGSEPTKEVLTLISSRMKAAKTKGAITERRPVVPSLLAEKVEYFCEEEDRVKAKFYAKCWRCSRRCEYCLARKKHFPKFGNFNTEKQPGVLLSTPPEKLIYHSLASPFLDVLESLIDNEEEEEENDDIEGDEEEKTDSDYVDNDDDDDNHDSDELYRCCISNNDFPLSESDDDIKEDDSSAVVNEMEEEDSDQSMFDDEW